MKVLIQWSRANPQDWEEIDSSQWAATVAAHKKPLPVLGQGNENINNAKGWVCGISVQGVRIDGDHIAIEDLHDGEGGIRVSYWSDDPEDIEDENYRAGVLEFKPLAPDAFHGGAYNTRIIQSVYAAPAFKQHYIDFPQQTACRELVRVYDWEDFVPPPENVTLHGVWMPDDLYQAHDAIRRHESWKEWTDGVPDDFCETRNGRKFLVPGGRQGLRTKKRGTITWFLYGSTLASGVHAANHELETGQTDLASPVAHQGVALGANSSALDHIWTSPSGEPGTATWPTGNYQVQIDIDAIGVNLSTGFRTAGTVDGHLARVNAGLTADQTTHPQVEPLFTTAGTHLATTGSVSWGTPSDTDRFEALQGTVRAPGCHGNRRVDIWVETSTAFMEGPWTVANVPQLEAVVTAASGSSPDQDLDVKRAIAAVSTALSGEGTNQDLDVARPLASIVTVLSDVSADLTKIKSLEALVVAQSAVSVALSKTIGIAAVAPAVSAVGSGGGSFNFKSATESNGGMTAGFDPAPVIPSGTLEGDALVCIVGTSDNDPSIAPTPPSGWTLQASGSMPIDGTGAASPPAIWIYLRDGGASADDEANAGTGTYTWTFSGAEEQFAVMINTDPATWGQFDKNELTGDRGPIDAPSVTTTVNNELVFHCGMKDGGTNFVAPPSGTEFMEGVTGFADNSGAGYQGVYEKFASPGPTGVKTFNGPNGAKNGYTFSLVSSAGPGGVPLDVDRSIAAVAAAFSGTGPQVDLDVARPLASITTAVSDATADLKKIKSLAAIVTAVSGVGSGEIPVLESFLLSHGGTTQETTLTLDKPSGVVAGDLLILIVMNDWSADSAQFSDNKAGWTFIEEIGTVNSDTHIAAFWRTATGSEGASEEVISVDPRVWAGHYLRISGHDITAPINVKNFQTRGASSTLPVFGVTTDVDNCLAIYAVAFDGGYGFPFSVSGAGWVEKDEGQTHFSGSGLSTCFGVKDQVSLGATGTATVTPSATDSSSSFQIAIAPGGGVQLDVARPIASIVAAVSTGEATLDISGVIALVAVVAAVSGVGPNVDLDVARPLASITTALSTASASLNLTLAYAAVVAAAVVVGPDVDLGVRRSIAALVNAVSDTGPDLDLDVLRLLNAVTTALSTGSATLDIAGKVSLQSVVTAISAVGPDADLDVLRSIAATVAAQAGVDALLGKGIEYEAIVTALSGTGPDVDLDVLRELAVMVTVQSGVGSGVADVIDKSLAVGEDEGLHRTSDHLFLPAPVTNHLIGETTGSNYYESFFLYPLIEIPKGSTIDVADLTFIWKATRTITNQIPLKIRAELVPNPGQITTDGEWDSRVGNVTSAGVDWDFPPGIYTIGNSVTSPNFAAVIQELIGQGAWAKNNAILIFLLRDGATNGVVDLLYNTAFTGGGGNDTTIHIEFTAPAGLPLLVNRGIAAVTSAATTAAASLGVTRSIAAVTSAVTTATAMLGRIRPLASVTTALSTAGATVRRIAGLSTVVAGVSGSVSAILNMFRRLVALVTGTSDVVSELGIVGREIPIEATVQAASSVQATLTTRVDEAETGRRLFGSTIPQDRQIRSVAPTTRTIKSTIEN